jgi:hypothetical protein
MGRRANVMLHRMWAVAGVGMILSACAAGGMGEVPAPIYPPSVYSQRVGTNEVSVYWSCVPGPGSIRFEGVVQNTKGGRVKFMELELGGVDARNRYVSDATTALPDVILQPSQISPFVIQLRPAGGEIRYDLFYRYQLDGAIGGDERPRFRALDVCSATAHRFTR